MKNPLYFFVYGQTRKPALWLVLIFTLLVMARAQITGQDLLPNVTSVLTILVPVVIGAYFGTSTYESCHGKDFSQQAEDKAEDKKEVESDESA
jgi:hypothetical protein